MCVLLLACAFSGCLGSDDSANNTTYTPVTTVTVNKIGLTIGANEMIQTILPENPSTGYTWEVIPTPGLNVEETYVANENSDGMVGVGGYKIYNCTGDARGPYVFTVVYKRANEEPLYTYTQRWDYASPIANPGTEPRLQLTYEGQPTTKVGEVVEIKTRGNPTTGYSWSAMNSGDDNIKVLDSKYIEDEHEEGMTGVGGTYVWYVTAEKPGSFQFDGAYSRNLEDEPEIVFYFDLVFVE
ncbi:protease inhibitor I42 family protein [Methanimicrococcus sp. OttesenSCG-928-J09]|nr:protease inhibitor I42 family protein [Methanimicrococcus sp. OttesenSCG-928-J09]